MPSIDIKHDQIILWVSIAAAGREEPPQPSFPFPAVLDLGFDIRPTSGGLMPTQFGATLRLEAGYKSRANPEMWSKVKSLATLHMNSMWKLDSSTRLRAQLSGLGNDWRTTFYPTITPPQPNEPEVIAQSMQVRSKRLWSAALMLEKDF